MKSINRTSGNSALCKTLGVSYNFPRSPPHPVSGRNVTALPNSLDFGDILKFGTLGAGVGCAKGPNSGDFAQIVGWNTKAGPCVGGALGMAVVRLIH